MARGERVDIVLATAPTSFAVLRVPRQDIEGAGRLATAFRVLSVSGRLAPRVAYRRRDALALLFPPGGIRIAWIVGTRLGQLPHRDWPARTDGIELQGRQATRIAAAVNRYRLWRHRRVEQGAAALPRRSRARHMP